MTGLTRRGFGAALGGAAVAGTAAYLAAPGTANAMYHTNGCYFKDRLTGVDKQNSLRFGVGGTDLGIPYLLENRSVGFLFGDTYTSAVPGGTNWRSPVMLRSNRQPHDGIWFDSAARVAGERPARQLIDYKHDSWRNGYLEHTLLPNDATALPDGRQVLSFWSSAPGLKANFSSLAVTNNGNDFRRLDPNVRWHNHRGTDPFQWWTMQYDPDGFIYIFSVQATRGFGPMMLRRVRWHEFANMNAYEDWGYHNGHWGWGRRRGCTPILHGHFGEPSVRRLDNGLWVMSYMNYEGSGRLVTRTAPRPDRVWTDEKVHARDIKIGQYYGGFIHPYSTAAPGNLHFMVSRWVTQPKVYIYHVEHWVSSV